MNLIAQCVFCSRSVGFTASWWSTQISFECEKHGLLNDDELVWSEATEALGGLDGDNS
jgi:hypothetical protein